MDQILFINACVRENSRTLVLAKEVLNHLPGEITEVNLADEKIKPLDRELLSKRDGLVGGNDFSDGMFKYAKDFANADTIVMAAPYWDLMFPALLKAYLEQITVSGITFRYIDGVPHGLCRAKRMIYVTTAGGPIYMNFGFEYVKALAETFFGIEEVLFFKAEGLDIIGADIEGIMREAKDTVRL